MTLNLKSKEFNFFYQGPRRALGIKAPFFPEFVSCVGTYLPDLALKKTHAIWLSEHDPQSLDGPIQQPTPLGETQFIALKWDPDQVPLEINLEIQLPTNAPLLLWRTRFKNISGDDVFLIGLHLCMPVRLIQAPQNLFSHHGNCTIRVELLELSI